MPEIADDCGNLTKDSAASGPARQTFLAAAIGRVAKERNQQRNVVVLGALAGLKTYRNKVEEGRFRSDAPTAAKILAHMKYELIRAAPERLAGKQRRRRSPVRIGSHRCQHGA